MASCPACKADVAAGTRWCGLCHTYVTNPAVGRLASPGKRLGAFVLDILIPVFAAFFVGGLIGLGGAAAGDRGSPVGGLLIFVLLIAFVVWEIKLFSRGTTPGKHALNMVVVKENGEPAGFGTMLVREWIGKLISGLVFSLGYLWILIDKDRQGWHDKLASTYVVEKG